METYTVDTSMKFSIIFEEVEKYRNEQSNVKCDSCVSQDDIRTDEVIREFSEICRDITQENITLTFHTFS